MFKYLTVLLLGISALTVNAQNKDYIITKQGDTIRCKIKGVLFNSSIRFKTDTMKDYKEESASTIKQYFRHKEKAPQRAVTLPNKHTPEFLTLLEEGKINLYEKMVMSGGYPTSYTYTYWFVQKGTDSVMDIKSNALINKKSRKERKEDLIALISDNKDVLGQYTTADSFSFNQIQATIHYYNTGEAPKAKAIESSSIASTESN
jgi:hypothetical protein